MLRLLTAAVFGLILVSGAGAIPPDKNKDAAAKAKAIFALSAPCPECPTVTKAKSALATSGIAQAVAPMPREKHVAAVVPKDGKPEKMTVDLDCTSGTCHPVLPGYARGTDGIYRPTGVVPQRERR